MKGWVYIITNKAMPNLLKVGFSTKDPESRANELHTTGVPHRFIVEYDALVNEPRDVEQKAHVLLTAYHENKEWFRCDITTAIIAIRQAANRSIIHQSNNDDLIPNENEPLTNPIVPPDKLDIIINPPINGLLPLTTTIENIVKEFQNEFNILLSKMPRKNIIYDGQTKVGTSIVVVMPASKVYERGNGWVDFTKIQIDIFKQYKIAIGVFRLSNGLTYYVDMQYIYPLLTKKNMVVNDREGEHWKLDVWTNKIVIRNGGETLYVKSNEKQFISQLL